MTETNNGNAQANTSKVFVSKTELPDQDKTLIGFGSLNEYEGKTPTPNGVMGRISQINNFLNAVDAGKVPITIHGKDENNKDVFMKADCWTKAKVADNGMPYRMYKMSIELQPEKRNEVGELVQEKQVLYATKREGGYSFDQNNDEALKNKFEQIVSRGVDFGLSAQHNKTLENYPSLMAVVNKIEKSAQVDLAFVKQKGVMVSDITPIGQNGEVKQGEKIMLNNATEPKKESIDR